ncbi:hypothetical protein [Chryseobacterium gambrini]|uniref:hypothetical protein n=1 Tax=Chryseobacterium gambrini TaxID=373672 RepID=UPI0022F14F13|nr:hypothetical protein [Chryseobacterium gambrini]WBV53047.1 hypothetical protein PFY09_01760 [Chryseobacterium gambrini]
MPIIRRSEQNQQSLQDFYREFLPKPGDTFGNAGIPMLKILDFINDTFKDTFIYGLTSHAHLLLFNNDEEDKHYVEIIGFQSESYEVFAVQYFIPEHKSPWKNAVVKGETTQFEEFKKMIVISMMESGGWKDNLELINFQKIM